MPLSKDDMRKYMRVYRQSRKLKLSPTALSMAMLTDLDYLDEARHQGLPVHVLTHIVIPH